MSSRLMGALFVVCGIKICANASFAQILHKLAAAGLDKRLKNTLVDRVAQIQLRMPLHAPYKVPARHVRRFNQPVAGPRHACQILRKYADSLVVAAVDLNLHLLRKRVQRRLRVQVQRCV